MEEKEDQSPKINPSTPGPDPSTALGTSGQDLPSARDFGDPSQAAQAEEFSLPAGRQGLTLSLASSPPSSKPELGAVERVNPEEEKRREVDLNVLFPGKNYDLNRLFPDEGTKKLLYELRRNKRDIERFIKKLYLEEE